MTDVYASLNVHVAAGTGAVVISPTRELSLQTYGVVRDLCKFHMQVNEHIVREHKSVVCIQHTRLLHPQYDCFDLSTPVFDHLSIVYVVACTLRRTES